MEPIAKVKEGYQLDHGGMVLSSPDGVSWYCQYCNFAGLYHGALIVDIGLEVEEFI